MLDDATEAVTMGSNDHVLPSFDFRSDHFVPKRQSSSDGVLQGLTCGQLARLQTLVASGLK